MGVSFTFVTILSTIAANYGYPTVIGCVMIGGIFEGTLGLFAKYWRKLISPIVAALLLRLVSHYLLLVRVLLVVDMQMILVHLRICF